MTLANGTPAGSWSAMMEYGTRIVAGWLGLFIEPGRVHELRALDVRQQYGRPQTVAGFFDDLQKMARQALRVTDKADGVYFTLNPVDPALKARRGRNNSTSVCGTGDSAGDQHVLCRRWLLIDPDPVRVAKVSSTDAEKAAGEKVTLAIREALRGRGWPEPVFADSGNSYHLLYRIDLPKDDGGLVERALKALAAQFDTDHVKVDTSVFNPARICTLYGSLAAKGENTPERPHRRSRLLEVPGCPDRLNVSGATILPVPRELLEQLAAEAPVPSKPAAGSAPANGTFRHRLKVGEWLTARGVQYTTKPLSGGRWETAYLLSQCPFNAEHTGDEVAIFQAADGKLGAKCFHNSCGGKGWKDFKEAIGKPDADHWDPPLESRRGKKNTAGGRRKTTAGPNGTNGSADGNGHAGDGTPQDKGPRLPLEAEDDPHRLARVFLWGHIQDLFREQPDVPPERIKLRYWREEWYEWDGYAYCKVPDREVRARVTAAVKAEFDRLNLDAWRIFEAREDKKEDDEPPEALKATTNLVGDVLQALGGMVWLPATVEPPAWISGQGRFPADEVLAAGNALVHLPSLVEGSPEFSCSPTLDYFSLNVLDYDFDVNVPPPSCWLEFLQKVLPDDPDSIGALQEWLGYFLTPDTSLQKILMLIGPTRSGKGTIARVIRALVGKHNVAGPTLGSLGTNFGLWPLVGKTVAVISDARIGRRSDLAAITERLLSISGEDALTVDRKHLTPVTLKLPTRLVLLTNELPNLEDSSGALAGRMVILHLPRSWYGREDPALTGRLLPELPGILLWAIAGWQRLRERGRFLQPESGRELLEELQGLSSPVGQFVDECCRLAGDQQTTRDDLWICWKGWARDNGKHAGQKSVFGRNLRASCHGLRDAQPTIDGQRVRVYQGIGLTARGEALRMREKTRGEREQD
jgi:putative DNA primase/helicase